MNSWNSRCPGLGSVVPSTLLALWSGRWPRIQTSAEGARTPALKIVQPFLSSDIIWYLKLSKYHQISFVCTDAPLLQFQDSKPVGIAFKSTKCHKQGYLYGSRHLSPSSFKIYFHHTSPYFTILQLKSEIGNWDHWDLSLCGQILHIKPVVLCYAATPCRGTVPCRVQALDSRRVGTARQSHGAVPWLGFTWGHPMGIPVGCLPSSSMIFAWDLNWISRKFSINLVSNHQGCMKIRSPSWIAPKWNPTFWYWICYFGCLGMGLLQIIPTLKWVLTPFQKYG